MLVFHTHTCLLIACLHAHCMLAYPSLAYLHCVLAECQCVCVSVSVEVSVYVVRMWWKCQCVSVSVEVSVFKGFSGRTLRNAFGKNWVTSTKSGRTTMKPPERILTKKAVTRNPVPSSLAGKTKKRAGSCPEGGTESHRARSPNSSEVGAGAPAMAAEHQ